MMSHTPEQISPVFIEVGAHDVAVLAREELEEVYELEEHEEQIGVVKVYKLEPTDVKV